MSEEINKTEDGYLRDLEKIPTVLSDKEQAVLEDVTGSKWSKYRGVTMAALGALPWVGSLFSMYSAYSEQKDQGHSSKLMYLWVREHEEKLKEIPITLDQIFARLDAFGGEIKTRIESQEYLTLVRSTFKIWDKAETLEKKEMLRKLITNAGGLQIAEDDLIRLFLEWLDNYHEFHFMVIREIYKNPNITRAQIWLGLKDDFPREDSAEAHLFKLLINDLSLGEVITQAKNVSPNGQYLKNRPQKRNPSPFHQTVFDDTKPYVLTSLGMKFVHYVMDDLAPQIENKGTSI